MGAFGVYSRALAALSKEDSVGLDYSGMFGAMMTQVMRNTCIWVSYSSWKVRSGLLRGVPSILSTTTGQEGRLEIVPQVIVSILYGSSIIIIIIFVGVKI